MARMKENEQVSGLDTCSFFAGIRSNGFQKLFYQNEGGFTFEALYLYEGFHEDFYPVEAKYLHDMVCYLTEWFEKCSAAL